MKQIVDDPKEHLLTTAEHLFAEYGIEAVSARQIALAAGQRNQSAVHYHFGTKDALIHSLRERRVKEINERRRVMLEEIVRNSLVNDLRSLIGAIILPLAEKVEQTPNGGDYVRFLAHLFSDRRRRDLWMASSDEAALLRRIYRLVRRQTPSLSEPLWAERLRFVVGGMINAFVDRERTRITDSSAASVLPNAVFVNQLIDSCVAIFMGPISDATQVQLSQTKSVKGGQECYSLQEGSQPNRAPRRSKLSGKDPRLEQKYAR